MQTEVTPEGTFAINEDGSRVLIFGPPVSEVITLNELMSSREAILQKETADRLNLTNFLTPAYPNLRATLLKWAAEGFPECYTLFSISIQLPDQCSDGVVRDVFQYIEYILGKQLSTYMQELGQKVSGFHFSYSVPGNELKLHVSKS